MSQAIGWGVVLATLAAIILIIRRQEHPMRGDLEALIAATREPQCPDCGTDPCRVHDRLYWAVLESKEGL